jgi:hypothetical protein
MKWRPGLLSLSMVLSAIHCVDPAITVRGVNLADDSSGEAATQPVKAKSNDPASLSLDLN